MNLFEHHPATSPEHRVDLALRNIEFSRRYTLTLLEDLEPTDWFWQPQQSVTHIAWQVGHLAMAQYGLTLFRQRGRQPVDTELMSGSFRKKFSRGTEPNSDPAFYPSPDEILEVFHRVHEQMRQELSGFAETELDEPIDEPHAAFATRFGALLFAANHEMIHAGQIGLLRRLMGKSPVR